MKSIKFVIFFLFLGIKSLSAQNADVYIMTGNARDYLGDLQGALANYTLAIEDDSTSAMAYFNRAYIKRKLNDYEGAIADYTMAIKYKPVYLVAFNNRGIVYMLLGKKSEACADWETANSYGYPDARKLLDEYCYNKKSDTLKTNTLKADTLKNNLLSPNNH